MKKWLSRGIVLAMALAMMIPAPVLAKSSSKSGGKLLKSVVVSEYSYYDNGELRDTNTYKCQYTYDNKNNPKTIKTTNYYNPVGAIHLYADSETDTFKYKYKGKTPKSLRVISEAGLAKETRQYYKGRAAIITDNDAEYEEYDPEEGWCEYGGNFNAKGTYAVTYTKKGLATEVKSTFATNDGKKTVNGTVAFGINQKNGIPNVIVQNHKADDGSLIGSNQSIFGKKGLVVEDGWLDANGNYTKTRTYEYGVKKGQIVRAVVYEEPNEWNGNKRVKVAEYQFTYTKTKISKVRYMNMMNEILRPEAGYFSWY